MLLRRPGNVVAGLKGKQYQKMLADLDPSFEEAAPKTTTAMAPRKRARPNDDDEVHGDTDNEAAPAAHADDDVHGSSDSNSASGSRSNSSSSSSKSSHSSVDGGSSDDDADFPKLLNGKRLRKEAHPKKGDEGLRTSCPVHGAKCRAFRTLTVDVGFFGVQAPMFYLGAWQLGAHSRTFAEHRKWRPSRADVRAYIASLG
jgi:hypothetical protein